MKSQRHGALKRIPEPLKDLLLALIVIVVMAGLTMILLP